MTAMLGKISVANRIRLIALLSLLALIGLAGYSLSSLDQQLRSDRRAQLSGLVETAHSLLAGYGAAVQRGEMDESQARERALEGLRAMRHDGDNYFWVSDLDATMVMHPVQSELEGRDMSGFRDAGGFALFVEIARVAGKDGKGFVSYNWPRPGADDAVEKLSFVQLYRPWGWVVGTGVYVDDISQAYWTLFGKYLLFFLGVSGILLAASLVMGRSISQPLGRLVEVMDRVRESGDIGQRADIRQGQELGRIGAAFDGMLEELGRFVSELDSSSRAVADAARELSAISGQTNDGISRQQVQTAQVATAMTEMSATVTQIAGSTAETANATGEADRASNNGQRVVDDTLRDIGALATGIREADVMVQRLAENTHSVGTVLDVIRGVAEQTNLLALNAAIEAARAGEQGRGFAVVADEVRHLAQRTQDSTQEIQNIIGNVQAGASEVVAAIQAALEQADTSVQSAENARQRLVEVNEVVDHIKDMAAQIATAAEEQSVVAEDVSQNVGQISLVSEENAVGARRTADASSDLSALADKLRALSSRYKAH